MNIIFGTKRLGQTAAAASSAKYPDLAVVTVEGTKEAKKSRRILFNKTAAAMLGFQTGETQQSVFGSLIGDSSNRLLITNISSDPETVGEMTTYKTSKNNVSYDGTSEKGKAITSSFMCNEISGFLGLDNKTTEFQLVEFDSDQVEAFEFVAMTEPDTEPNTQPTEAGLENNNGALYSPEEIVGTTRDEVLAQEEAAPVLQRAATEDY
jgi:hypothetical protein